MEVTHPVFIIDSQILELYFRAEGVYRSITFLAVGKNINFVAPVFCQPIGFLRKYLFDASVFVDLVSGIKNFQNFVFWELFLSFAMQSFDEITYPTVLLPVLPGSAVHCFSQSVPS